MCIFKTTHKHIHYLYSRLYRMYTICTSLKSRLQTQHIFPTHIFKVSIFFANSREAPCNADIYWDVLYYYGVYFQSSCHPWTPQAINRHYTEASEPILFRALHPRNLRYPKCWLGKGDFFQMWPCLVSMLVF